MSSSLSWRKVPPGLRFIASLSLDWKPLSLFLILSGVFKPDFWQAILIFSISLPLSVAALVCLRNYRHAKRQKQLGAEFPPSIPSRTFGGLDVVKALRREYHFGYIGDSSLEYPQLRYRINAESAF